LLSSDAKGLAGKARANHVRNSSVLLGCTGLHELTHVRKDWSGIEVSVGNPGGNDSLAVFVPLDVSDMGPAKQPGAE
jgi:hypothetical protein